jgi:hypothetical protein
MRLVHVDPVVANAQKMVAAVEAVALRLVDTGIAVTGSGMDAGLRFVKFRNRDRSECEVYWEADWPR